MNQETEEEKEEEKVARIKHETEEDRTREGKVKRILCKIYNCCFEKAVGNAHYSQIDYFAFSDETQKLVGTFEVGAGVGNGMYEISGLHEIKCRNFSWGYHDEILLSFGKWETGLSYSRASGKPFYFVVAPTIGGGIYRYKQDENHVKNGQVYCKWGGRTVNKRDSGDVEPVMMIPISLFEKISDKDINDESI